MPTETMPAKKPQSVELTKAEYKALKEYRKKYDTAVSCAISLGLDRNVLNNILLKGSGHPDTVEKIRTAFNSLNEG